MKLIAIIVAAVFALVALPSFSAEPAKLEVVKTEKKAESKKVEKAKSDAKKTKKKAKKKAAPKK